MSRKPDPTPSEAIANSERQAHDRNSQRAPDKDPSGPRIPVARLFFRHDVRIDLPGVSTSSVTAGGHRGQKRWELAFLPRLGMYELRFAEPSKDNWITRLIPREWAMAEPA